MGSVRCLLEMPCGNVRHTLVSPKFRTDALAGDMSTGAITTERKPKVTQLDDISFEVSAKQ